MNNKIIKTKPIKLVKTKEDENSFINDCLKLYESSKKHNKTFCGIDFEFNMIWKTKTRYIGLMQIIMIFNSDKYYEKEIKPIYVLSPKKLSKKNKELMIKYIFCSNVTKIFHGSDSLDYPHIYTELFFKNNNKFLKFINNSVDTRFLCEISKRIMGRLGIQVTNKCSIYNSLLDHGIIDDKKFNELSKVASKVNYNKDWIIEKLKEHQVIYASYDVIYLFDLLHNIVNRFSCESEICINNKLDPVSLINRLYRFHMINRLKICELTKISENLLANNKKFTKDNRFKIDTMIMELKLEKINYIYKNKKNKITLYIEDILSLDTIRKSILQCMIVYQIDNAKDIDYLDMKFKTSQEFLELKGNNTISYLINLVKNSKKYNFVSCDKNISDNSSDL